GEGGNDGDGPRAVPLALRRAAPENPSRPCSLRRARAPGAGRVHFGHGPGRVRCAVGRGGSAGGPGEGVGDLRHPRDPCSGSLLPRGGDGRRTTQSVRRRPQRGASDRRSAVATLRTKRFARTARGPHRRLCRVGATEVSPPISLADFWALFGNAIIAAMLV